MAHQIAMHACQADGCEAQVPTNIFMCRKHWYMVPKQYQGAIWASYRPGQEVDHRPSDAYRTAAFAAVEAVARQEGRRRRDS